MQNNVHGLCYYDHGMKRTIYNEGDDIMNELVKRGKYYSGVWMHEEAYRYFLEAALSEDDGDAYNWLRYGSFGK